jgi:hypothetical protein
MVKLLEEISLLLSYLSAAGIPAPPLPHYQTEMVRQKMTYRKNAGRRKELAPKVERQIVPEPDLAWNAAFYTQAEPEVNVDIDRLAMLSTPLPARLEESDLATARLWLAEAKAEGLEHRAEKLRKLIKEAESSALSHQSMLQSSPPVD